MVTKESRDRVSLGQITIGIRETHWKSVYRSAVGCGVCAKNEDTTTLIA